MKLNWNILIFACLGSTASLFGFFFAWVCSTMWGLDSADPRVAIAAMQAMNASVRNGVFAMSFFGTPIVLIVTTLAAFIAGRRLSSFYLGCATLVTLTCGIALTMIVHVPMNEALALQDVPKDIEDARQIWQSYSPNWQWWNIARTIAMGVAFAFAVQGAVLSHSKQSPTH